MSAEEIAQLSADLAKFGLSLASFSTNSDSVVDALAGTVWTSSNGSTLTKNGPGSYKIHTP